MLLLFILIEDVFLCQFYIYRQMVDMYIYVCVCVCVHTCVRTYLHTLLSIYISEMSDRDHENLTNN